MNTKDLLEHFDNLDDDDTLGQAMSAGRRPRTDGAQSRTTPAGERPARKPAAPGDRAPVARREDRPVAARPAARALALSGRLLIAEHTRNAGRQRSKGS